MKTGGWGGPWVVLERPKPPAVGDLYQYWGDPPPEQSERCAYWLRQIERGWRPNGNIETMGRDATALWYGVYMWEYLHAIAPRLKELRDGAA